MPIDDRKQRVLHAIVTLYGADGEPVGSGLLAEYFAQAVSSATLRNEMAALTKLGLLEQPHTSAGRVPSAKGYRYYLDHLIELPPCLSVAERDMAEQLFRGMDYDPERLTQAAAEQLAAWTGYTAAATTPCCHDLGIAHYEVMQVGRFAAAVLAVTNAGGVLTRTAKLDFPLEPADAARVARALNQHLRFRSAVDVQSGDLQAAAQAVGVRGALCYPILSAAYTLLKEAGRQNVYLQGEQNMLNYAPEQALRRLLVLLGDTDALKRLLAPHADRTTVLLGEDFDEHPLTGICLVKTVYVAGGGRTGSIGLIGPARMPYHRVLPRLEYFALLLGQYMSGTAPAQLRAR